MRFGGVNHLLDDNRLYGPLRYLRNGFGWVKRLCYGQELRLGFGGQTDDQQSQGKDRAGDQYPDPEMIQQTAHCDAFPAARSAAARLSCTEGGASAGFEYPP